MKITDVQAIQILDSRGNPTLKVSVAVDGIWGSFSVPSGASTGIHEALELRDSGKAYNGLGVTKALANVVGPIKGVILGQDPTNLAEIDRLMIELDGTKNKSKLGANAILGVSGAVVRATAEALKMPLYQYLRELYENDGHFQPELKLSRTTYVLPKMFFNIVNGGVHASNNIDIQETMIVPQRDSVAENIRIASEVYHSLKSVLNSRNLSTGLGDEGGFAPNLESNTKALDLILEAIEKAGYKVSKDVCLALDVAASELYDPEKDSKYILNSEGIGLSSQQMTSWYKELMTTYPIISIEDGLSQDDWGGWVQMTERIGGQIQLIGDDLFVTNVKRIQQGIDNGAANSVLIKVNQIGSISETFTAIKFAVRNGYKCMISHRSGETEDSFIADLAVATGVGQIKSGAPARGERTAKYNRLLEIEQEIAV
jgi:enolase